MKCARCQKALTKAAHRDGPFSWGPKCAKLAGFPQDHHAQQSAHSKDDAQMPLQLTPAPDLIQGHKYRAPGFDADLIAIEPGGPLGTWRVREISGEWLGASHHVYPDDVVPLPMKYFHGQIPA